MYPANSGSDLIVSGRDWTLDAARVDFYSLSLVSETSDGYSTAITSGSFLLLDSASDGTATLYVGNTGVQRALTQHIAISADYTYHQYRFDGDVALPAGFSNRRASQGVHAYLSLWAPIFQSRGITNASR